MSASRNSHFYMMLLVLLILFLSTGASAQSPEGVEVNVAVYRECLRSFLHPDVFNNNSTKVAHRVAALTNDCIFLYGDYTNGDDGKLFPKGRLQRKGQNCTRDVFVTVLQRANLRDQLDPRKIFYVVMRVVGRRLQFLRTWSRAHIERQIFKGLNAFEVNLKENDETVYSEYFPDGTNLVSTLACVKYKFWGLFEKNYTYSLYMLDVFDYNRHSRRKPTFRHRVNLPLGLLITRETVLGQFINNETELMTFSIPSRNFSFGISFESIMLHDFKDISKWGNEGQFV